MSRQEYFIRENLIYSAKGRLVASIEPDGSPVMAPGMAGPHSRAVLDFLNSISQNKREKSLPQENRSSRKNSDIPYPEMKEKLPAPSAVSAPSVEEWEIETIPEELLPPFSKALGVNTPGFASFIGKYRLSPAQVGALIRRLSK